MDFGIYIHFPFCRSKCGYCDFYSQPTNDIPHSLYADAIEHELNRRWSEYQNFTLKTVYFGGGTPSLWHPREIGRILQAIKEKWVDSPSWEITLEVNPGTIAPGQFDTLLNAGVNRLSLGIQSLDNGTLSLLTRIHDVQMAMKAVEGAKRVGFSNINCDIIFGTPQQTLDGYLTQLKRLVELEPQGISCYGLSLSPDAPLRQQGYLPADDDLLAEMMEAGREFLEEQGYFQYEVSNYAKQGYSSRHNMMCWEGKPYLGLGAAAHSMQILGRKNLRSQNPLIQDYLANWNSFPDDKKGAVNKSSVEIINEPMSYHEIMFLGLRTTSGVHRADFFQRFGFDPLDYYSTGMEKLQKLGLLRVNQEYLFPTKKGIWYADEIAICLMD